jgi:hypothetical protein
MKQNPQFVNGYKAPRYLCKVDHSNWLHRLIWWAFRRYLLNEDYYRVRRMFNGPRPFSRYFTRKADATASRYYVEPRQKPRRAVVVAPWRVSA